MGYHLISTLVNNPNSHSWGSTTLGTLSHEETHVSCDPAARTPGGQEWCSQGKHYCEPSQHFRSAALKSSSPESPRLCATVSRNQPCGAPPDVVTSSARRWARPHLCNQCVGLPWQKAGDRSTQWRQHTGGRNDTE